MWSYVLCLLLAVLCVRGQEHQADSEIAFSVGLSRHQNVTSGQKVLFDRIFSNLGGGYNSNTGIFTCPQSGVYVFQVHALTRSDADMWLELDHNYKYIVSVWGHNDYDYAAGSNSAILPVTKNDQVYVRGVQGYTSRLYGQDYEVYATFSGYLIQATHDNFIPVGK